MANETGTTVRDLPEKIEAIDDDVLLIVDINGTNYFITLKNLLNGINIPTMYDLQIDKVNNTSDIDKPLSTAIINALKEKAPQIHEHETSSITGLEVILTDLSGRISLFENEVDLEKIRSYLNAEVNKLIETLDLTNHSHTADQIVNLEDFIKERFADQVLKQVTEVVTPALNRMEEIELDLTNLKEQLKNFADVKHRHVIDEVDGLEYFTKRAIIAPLDTDDGITGNDGWE